MNVPVAGREFSSLVFSAAIGVAWVLLAAGAGLAEPVVVVERSGRPGVAVAPGTSAPSGVAGLHIEHSGQISFRRGSYIMTDGGGYRWDLQYDGRVNSGTNRAYSGAMYCRVAGSNFRTNDHAGWVNKAGDEIELGPWNRNNLNIYRRIRVYKDRPLARWLEIFQNPTGSPIAVKVQIYISTNQPIRQITTNTGGSVFGKKDWAFRTRSTRPDCPATLHVVTSRRAKIRPTVQMHSNQIQIAYDLTVPGGKTVILCHFESQDRNPEGHVTLMKKFPTYRLLRDLGPSVRAVILNMHAAGGIGAVDLDRSGRSDTVLLKSGDPIYGAVRNASFRVASLLGLLDLPAEKVVGMAGGPDGRVRFVLADGQVVSGTAAEATLSVALDGGGLLNIPFGKISQWSYRISKSRPDEVSFAGAQVLLRTGDRLAFDADALALRFRTRHGLVDLHSRHLLEISLDNPGNAVHRAVFLNGSHLAGFLEPAELVLPLRLGRRVTVSRNLVVRMRFAAEERPDPTLTRVLLTNGDELFGTLVDETFQLTSEYGKVDLSPAGIKTMRFRPEDLGRTVVQMWNGSVHRGRLARPQLCFEVASGTRLNIYVGQFVSLTCPLAIPPKEVRRRIEELVAQLGAESYKDREAATKALVDMGPAIIPLVRPHINSGDPEVRQRLEDVLEQLGAEADGPRGFSHSRPATGQFRFAVEQ